MSPIQPIQHLRRNVLLAVVAIVLLIVGYWWYANAYVEITVESNRTGAVQYELLNSDRHIKIENTSKTIKKRVPRGTYELLVSLNGESYFSIVRTGSFLSTSSVRATLSPEKGREFVGTSPKSCLYLPGGTLYSYTCGSSTNTLSSHVPATDTSPTFPLQTEYASEDVIEGFADTQLGQIMMLYTAEVAGHEDFEEFHSPHIAYLIDSNLGIQDIKPLPQLDGETLYGIAPYRLGFLVYGGKTVLYYPSFQSSGERLDLSPDDDAFSLYTLNTKDDDVAAAYSTEITREDKANPKKFADRSSQVVLRRGNSELRRVSFDKTYSTLILCGQQKLCGLSERQLDVFDISGGKKKLITLTDIDAITAIGNKLVLAKRDSVIGLDLEKMEGSIEYSLGDYTSCGLQAVGDSYAVCVAGPKNLRSTLLIDPSKENDDIDKKVLKLLEIGEVRTISPYRSFLYISPQAGDMIYNQDLKIFTYDPVGLKAVTDKIIQAAKQINLDTTKYILKNTLE